MDQTVDVKRQEDGSSLSRRFRSNADVQLVTEPFAQVQTDTCGLLDHAPILSGKAFFKNARQVGGGNPDSVVLHHEDHLILLPAGGNAAARTDT